MQEDGRGWGMGDDAGGFADDCVPSSEGVISVHAWASRHRWCPMPCHHRRPSRGPMRGIQVQIRHAMRVRRRTELSLQIGAMPRATQ